MRKKSEYLNLLYFVLIVLILEAFLFSIGDLRINEAITLENDRVEKAQSMLGSTPVEAKAVSVYDISQNKKIYGMNDTVALPLASLAKIITVVTALNNYDQKDTIYISDDAIKQSGDYGLFANEKWQVADLAKLTLIVSANDGAYTFAERIPNFLQKVNDKAKRIGMQKALFLNATGLDFDTGKAGAFATAEDVNTMASFALQQYPEIFSVTTLPEIDLESESGFEHNFKNTDTIIAEIPNLLLSKTGYTDIAGGNLCVIFKNQRGQALAVTLLGSTFEGRFTDMEKIVNVLYSI